MRSLRTALAGAADLALALVHRRDRDAGERSPVHVERVRRVEDERELLRRPMRCTSAKFTSASSVGMSSSTASNVRRRGGYGRVVPGPCPSWLSEIRERAKRCQHCGDTFAWPDAR